MVAVKLAQAQAAAVQHLETVDPGYDDEDGWFCGCYTCIVREVFTGAWPILAELLDG